MMKGMLGVSHIPLAFERGVAGRAAGRLGALRGAANKEKEREKASEGNQGSKLKRHGNAPFWRKEGKRTTRSTRKIEH